MSDETEYNPNAPHPNAATANAISMLLAAGFRQIDIAKGLRISTQTMHNHYKAAIEAGAWPIYTVVASHIFKAAVTNKEPWALKLIANRRMGWSERTLQPDDPNPPTAAEANDDDIDRLLAAASPEELEIIDRLIARSTQQPGNDEPASAAPPPAASTEQP